MNSIQRNLSAAWFYLLVSSVPAGVVSFSFYSGYRHHQDRREIALANVDRLPSTGGALCRDGWISRSASRSGTCSWHGGVRYWGTELRAAASPKGTWLRSKALSLSLAVGLYVIGLAWTIRRSSGFGQLRVDSGPLEPTIGHSVGEALLAPPRLISWRPNHLHITYAGLARGLDVSPLVRDAYFTLDAMIGGPESLSFDEAISRVVSQGGTYFTINPLCARYGNEEVIDGVCIYYLERSDEDEPDLFSQWVLTTVSGGFNDTLFEEDQLYPGDDLGGVAKLRFVPAARGRPFSPDTDWELGHLAGFSLRTLQEHM